VVSATAQLKFLASDGKRRFADMLDYNGIIASGKEFPGEKQTGLLNGLLTVMRA
jgi:cell filamentation protein